MQRRNREELVIFMMVMIFMIQVGRTGRTKDSNHEYLIYHENPKFLPILSHVSVVANTPNLYYCLYERKV